MYLKKIEIFGFKSFAHKTEIHFERGVTGIVGPNGCGKSNISDAIRWVLGERSAKTLRGGKMEDVIFNGTEFRKPLGLAEVSLVIDNSDRTMNIAFDEVMITRRLYRSGESEYLINKTACRYKDIQTLILDTGIGSNSYSMIEQGKLDYILNAEEDERRFLIEEAAGISKYKLKKEEALRKLERTDANLLRLQDIVSEVEKNIKYAERQAQRARKYKEQFTRLKFLETQKGFIEVEQLNQEKVHLSGKLDSWQENARIIEDKIAEKENILSQLQDRIDEVEAVKSGIETKRNEILVKLSELNARIESNREKQEFLLNENAELEREMIAAEQRIKGFGQELAQKERDIVSVSAEREDWKRITDTVLWEYEAATQDFRSKEIVLNERRSTLFDIAGRLSEKKNKNVEVEITIQHKSSRLESLQRNQERLLREKEDLTARLRQISVNPELDVNIEECLRLENSLNERKKELQNSIQEVRAAMFEKKLQLQDFIAKLSLVETLAQQGMLENQMVEKFLGEIATDPAMRESIRLLTSAFDVKPGYELAAKAYIWNLASAVICETSTNALAVLELAKQKNAYGLTLLLNQALSLRVPRGSDISAYDGMLRLGDFVQARTGNESLIQKLFADAWVAEKLTQDLIERWMSNGGSFVTNDGYVLTENGQVRYFGDLLLAKADHLDAEELKKSIPAMELEIKSLENKEREFHAAFSLLDSEIEGNNKKMFTFKITKEAGYKEHQAVEAQLQKISRELDGNSSDLNKTGADLVELKDSLTRIAAELEDLLSLDKEEQAALRKINEEFNLLVQRKEEFAIKANEHSKRLERLTDQLRYTQESIELIQRNKDSEQEAQQKRMKKTAENTETCTVLSRGLVDAGASCEGLSVHAREYEIQAEDIGRQKSTLLQERNEFSTELNGFKLEQQQQKDLNHEIDLKKMDIDYRVQAVEQRLLQTYQIDLKSLDAAAYSLDQVDVTAMQTEVDVLKGKLESIGTVNLLAMDEYDSLKERFEFLNGQKQDLEKAKDELMEAIRKINRTTKQLFEDTFKAVCENFSEYFKVLFRGGEAKLVLVDESNPLESGIDIFVKPPGKKLSKISLLSGGEKALTATALLFALFKVKPSPFCVLDELDAPLDESNVDRFLNVVQGFLTTTQFLIVTHNRKTISSADTLYGVTMEEAGVSKLVSVRLNDNNDTAAVRKEDVEKDLSETV